MGVGTRYLARVVGVLAVWTGASYGSDGDADFATYDQIPLVSGDIDETRVLLHNSIHTACRLLILGDSQETSPGGNGRTYVPHLQRRFAEFSGGVDRTPIRGNTSFGSGFPPASWLGSSATAIGFPDDQGLESTWIPPGASTLVLSAEDLDAGDYGPRFTLLHDAAGTADPSWREGFTYIDPDAVAIEIFSLGLGKGPHRLEVVQRPTDLVHGWAAPTASEEIELVPHPSIPYVFSGRSGPLDRGAAKYVQVEVRPVVDGGDLVLLGTRFRQLGRDSGLGASVYSKGGNAIHRLLEEHGHSGWFLNLDRPSVVVIQFGANDVQSRTLLEFEADTRSLIEWLREAMDAPCLPVVLVSDPWQRVPVSLSDRLDRYPGVLAAVAADTPGVVAINQRKALEERFGWGPDDQSFLADDVHLTQKAQVDLADSLYDLMMGDPVYSSPGDLNADGCVDSEDFGILLSNWQPNRTECIPLGDLDRDGRVMGSDLGMFFMHWSGDC